MSIKERESENMKTGLNLNTEIIQINRELKAMC